MRITTYLSHRSVQILLLIVLYFLLSPLLPHSTHQLLYTTSLLIKDLLLWMLPVTVGLFIAHAIASFDKRAPLFILSLFLFEALSNSASVWYAYGWGHLAAAHLPAVEPQTLNDTFTPLWRLPLLKPSWWSADKGTFAGLGLGLLGALVWPLLKNTIAQGKQRAEWVLTKVFSRLIPLFVLGFVAKMSQTHLLDQLFTHYVELLGWLLIALVLYILLLFLLGSKGSFTRWTHSIKNLLPAAGIAFSSGCSLSTLPWTIEGTSKNLHDPTLAKAVIPATTNIQQIGDCIIQTFLCFLIYFHFNGHPPSLATWALFSSVFVLARFATAAVLGGAIFVMLPIYEAYLGFTPEMIAIILALNVLLDPIVTSSNVIANGALCKLFELSWGRIATTRKKHAPIPPPHS